VAPKRFLGRSWGAYDSYAEAWKGSASALTADTRNQRQQLCALRICHKGRPWLTRFGNDLLPDRQPAVQDLDHASGVAILVELPVWKPVR
jgi:hypothetical protein